MRLAALVLVFAFAWSSASAQSAGNGPPTAGDPNGIHGRIEVQDVGLFSQGNSLDAALGVKDRDDAFGNLRLTYEPTFGPWSLQVHYVVNLEAGPDVALARATSGLIKPPPATWLNLYAPFTNKDEFYGAQGLDRLAVAYTTPDWVIRVGRQALTWGSGMVFRPMDLFDPFSPTSTDTEYKPGTDMLYVQHLFADGSDLQFILVPRPARAGGSLTADASSIALHLHTTILGHSTIWLLARDHGDVVAGASVNGTIAGATWNLEVVPTFLEYGGVRVSGLANISDAVTLFGRNATVFGEYFHNGFGVTDRSLTLADLPPALLGRVSRGQVFNLRQDYLASGLNLEVTPLLDIGPTLIVDLNDGSVFALLSATYSLADNMTLVAGAQAPIGPSRSEFGGLPVSQTSALTFASPGQLYIQLRRYF